jgi:hypothetical protein
MCGQNSVYNIEGDISDTAVITVLKQLHSFRPE